MVKNLEFWKVKLLLTFCYLLHALIYDYYTPAPSGLVVIFHQHRPRRYRVEVIGPIRPHAVFRFGQVVPFQIGLPQVGPR